MSGAPNLHALIQLQQQLLAVDDKRTLAFHIVNDSKKLVSYDQAILFSLDRLQRLKLSAISGQIATIEDTPFTQWLKRLQRQALNQVQEPTLVSATDVADTFHAGWQEWWHQHTLVQPLLHRDKVIGLLLLNRSQSFSEMEMKSLGLLASHMSYALAALSRYRPGKKPLLARRKPLLLAGVGIALAALLTIQVPLSVTVNAEITPEYTSVVASPQDGIIATLEVEPNSMVQKGELLFTLDDTVLRNELNIAKQELVVAQVEARTMEQRAFSDMDSKAELASLRGRIREKLAQIELIESQLARTKVYSDFAGYAIYNDADDWLGVPVRTGERIIQLAAPEPLAVRGWIPVADVISLAPSAPFNLYLRSDPLTTYTGELTQHSFQPTVSPDGIAAYQFDGQLSTNPEQTQNGTLTIGARGAATLYGEDVSLAYFLMRRPLGVMRQWLGW